MTVKRKLSFVENECELENALIKWISQKNSKTYFTHIWAKRVLVVQRKGVFPVRMKVIIYLSICNNPVQIRWLSKNHFILLCRLKSISATNYFQLDNIDIISLWNINPFMLFDFAIISIFSRSIISFGTKVNV